MKKYFVSEPQLDGNEERYVLDALRSNRLSAGPYVQRFEERFARFCGTEHAVSCMNGTAALHLAMIAMGLREDDEVIIPTLTYVASANAVTYCGAKPVFCDVDRDTWCMDPADLKNRLTKQTVGLLPVHLYGYPAAMEAIRQFADTYGLWVVEDAAEAHGAFAEHRPVGSLGECGVFSFYGNKIITAGEGGMLVTDNSQIAHVAKLYRGQGVDTSVHRYHHEVVGYNYRMTELQAAVGLAQLERVQAKLQARRDVGRWYRNRFTGSPVQFQVPSENSTVVNWMVTVLMPLGVDRDCVMKTLGEQGVETRPAFRCMHQLPIYESSTAYPVAEDVSARGINLPTHAGLSKADVNHIADSVLGCLEAAV